MAGQEEVVVDTSVIIKWFSEEEGTEQALKVRDDHISGAKFIMAPDLMIYELSNALRFKPGFDNAKVGRAIADIFAMQIDLITPSEDLAKRCSNISFRFGITIYDACYLALGELMGIRVLTSDKKFYGLAKRSGFLALI
jgi:predicted nucleic acid-binding protein